jgi:long-chain acyl-CoA synthetase
MAENLYSLLLHAREKNGEGVFFSWNDKEYAFREMIDKTLFFEKYFISRGIRCNDRILIQLPNIPELIYAVFAAHKIGAVPVMVNPMARRYELVRYVEIAQPSLAVMRSESFAYFDLTGERFGSSMHVLFIDREDSLGEVYSQNINDLRAEQWAEVNDVHPAVILFTSADDGIPGGAMITHRGILETARLSGQFSIEETDVFLGALPLFHAFGLTTSLFLPLYNFCKVLLIDKFSVKKVASLLMNGAATIFCGVPIMFEILARVLKKTENIARVRSWISGGEAISTALQKQYQKEYGIEIRQGYGLTEASPIVTWNIGHIENRHGSIGIPLSYNSVRLMKDGKDVPDGEDGEIFVKGTNVVPGYYDNPEKTKANIKGGWLKTGDIAMKDADGYYFIRGRRKNMILRNGFNVYPEEVKIIFQNHPDVERVEVHGIVNINDEYSGKDVLCATIWRKPGSALTETRFREWCVANISAYKIPDEVKII